MVEVRRPSGEGTTLAAEQSQNSTELRPVLDRSDVIEVWRNRSKNSVANNDQKLQWQNYEQN